MQALFSPQEEARRFAQRGRCAECWLPRRYCYCADLGYAESPVPITVIIHARERGRASNSGHLAARSVLGAKVLPYGLADGDGAVPDGRGRPLDYAQLPQAGDRAAVLFPWPGAAVLSDLPAAERPQHLIILDGTWGQARRMAHRIHAALGLPFVTLGTQPCSRYVVRRQKQAGHLATLEAVAAAVAVYDGMQIGAVLQQNFALLVKQNLRMRGRDGGA